MLKCLSAVDLMYFAQLNDDKVIDQIPLAEINGVKEMNAVEKESDEAEDEKQLMIETHPEGYNSGRTYYLQAESKASCQDIIKTILRYCAAAYERAHVQSVFHQAQLRVLKVYRSTVFQRFVAFLIVSVCFSIFSIILVPESKADVVFDRILLSAC